MGGVGNPKSEIRSLKSEFGGWLAGKLLVGIVKSEISNLKSEI